MTSAQATTIIETAARIEVYRGFRRKYPHLRPVVAFRASRMYLNEEGAISEKEAICFASGGHRWVFTGTQYGGDDERWGGEGRCYCSKCGADGDQ